MAASQQRKRQTNLLYHARMLQQFGSHSHRTRKSLGTKWSIGWAIKKRARGCQARQRIHHTCRAFWEQIWMLRTLWGAIVLLHPVSDKRPTQESMHGASTWRCLHITAEFGRYTYFDRNPILHDDLYVNSTVLLRQRERGHWVGCRWVSREGRQIKVIQIKHWLNGLSKRYGLINRIEPSHVEQTIWNLKTLFKFKNFLIV